MEQIRAHIIEKLKKDILPLQGYKPVTGSVYNDINLGPIMQAFPEKKFPVGAFHEFLMDSPETAAATNGFIAAVLGRLMKTKGVSLWVGNSERIYPPALAEYNLEPGNLIFLQLKKDKEILWATEEALRCEAVTCVVAEVQGLGFTASRRLQLAVEQSRVTGFIIRKQFSGAGAINTTACVSRWRITPEVSSLTHDIPGVGFCRWNVELLKVRNGQPGRWVISWRNGTFEHEYKEVPLVSIKKQKTG